MCSHTWLLWLTTSCTRMTCAGGEMLGRQMVRCVRPSALRPSVPSDSGCGAVGYFSLHRPQGFPPHRCSAVTAGGLPPPLLLERPPHVL